MFGPPGTVSAVEYGSGATLTSAELEDRSRRLAGLWRSRGIGRGDHVAALLDNQVAYFEVAWAALRSGLYLTPINWHLGPEEAAYVLADCGARAVVSCSALGGLLAGLGAAGTDVPTRLVVGGDVEGWEPYEATVAAAEPIGDDDQPEGALMFYSSGTTGRPKGILPPLRDVPFGTPGALDMLVTGLFGFGEGLTYLCPAPLYHAAPLAWSLASQRLGGTVVVLERFDAADALEAIERHRITHAQFVPTHFVRMLKLDPAVRGRRPVEPGERRPRGRPLPARGQGGDARLVGPDRPRVLLGLGGRRVHRHRPRGVAGAPRLGGSLAAGRRAHRGTGRRGPADGRGGPDLVRDPGPLRVPRRPGQDRRGHQRPRLGDDRRHRLPRRGGVPVPDRPGGPHGDLGRREHLPPGDRGRPGRPPGRARRGRDRRSRRGDGRAPAGGRPAGPGRRRRATTWRPSSSATAAPTWRASSARGRSPSSPSCRASRPARSARASCARATAHGRAGSRRRAAAPSAGAERAAGAAVRPRPSPRIAARRGPRWRPPRRPG